MRQLVLLTDRNGLQWQRPESPYIIGFFHDLCKLDQYKIVRQDENGAPVYDGEAGLMTASCRSCC